MFNIVPLFFITISLGIIVVIIARKYPELTLLDLDTIPERKEKQKKKEIFTRKVTKRSQEQQEKIIHRLLPMKAKWKDTQSKFRVYVKKLKDEIEETKKVNASDTSAKVSQTTVSKVLEPTPSVEGVAETIEDCIKKGKRACEEKKFQEAESAFIRAIEIDQKNVPAYEGLGDVYMKQGQYTEAKETYLFAKKLDPKNISLLAKLAKLAEGDEQWVQAIQYYEEAVLVDDANAGTFAKLAELFQKTGEPALALEAIMQAVELRQNYVPYLDSLVEISIMVQDKLRAEKGIQAIRMLDPDYTRLTLLKDRVAELEDA